MKLNLPIGFCFLVSAGSMLAAYGLAHIWSILWIFAGMILIWLILRKQPGIWQVSIPFIVYLGLAVTGLLLGLSPYLMVIGCSAALAVWDLALFRKDAAGSHLQLQDTLLGKLHLKTLSFAIGLGLFLSILGLNIHLLLPFGGVAGLTLMTAFGLFGVFRFLRK